MKKPKVKKRERKTRKIKKRRRNSNPTQFRGEEKNTSIKMNPIFKILLILGLIIYTLLNVGTWGWWAPAGAIMIGIIVYLFFLESKGVDL